MSPLLLIVFDLVVSAALILLSMYVVWSRVQSRLEALSGKSSDAGVRTTGESGGDEIQRPSHDAAPDDPGFGSIPKQATLLKQKGCSLEEISQRLRLPTREVEMVLAISEMTGNESSGPGMPVPFRLDPKAAYPV